MIIPVKVVPKSKYWPIRTTYRQNIVFKGLHYDKAGKRKAYNVDIVSTNILDYKPIW